MKHLLLRLPIVLTCSLVFSVQAFAGNNEHHDLLKQLHHISHNSDASKQCVQQKKKHCVKHKKKQCKHLHGYKKKHCLHKIKKQCKHKAKKQCKHELKRCLSAIKNHCLIDLKDCQRGGGHGYHHSDHSSGDWNSKDNHIDTDIHCLIKKQKQCLRQVKRHCDLKH